MGVKISAAFGGQKIFDILELETLISKGKTLKFSASGGVKNDLLVRIY